MTRRLPVLRADDLTDAQQELYDQIAHGPRASGPQYVRLTDADGGLSGPFNAMLYSPLVGQALQALGAAIRYRTQLPARARELAVLVVAAAWDSAFERFAHEAIGRAVGLTDAEIDAVRSDSDLSLEDPVERATVTVARALARSGDLDDAQYADAQATLGLETLVELTTLVGYYATLALQLRVFRVGLPEQ